MRYTNLLLLLLLKSSLSAAVAVTLLKQEPSHIAVGSELLGVRRPRVGNRSAVE